MKQILTDAGFTYHGYCKICDGKAELYKKGNIECKVRENQMKFVLIVKGNKIIGKASELQSALEKYLPKETV